MLKPDFETGRARYREVAQRLLAIGVRVFSYRSGSYQLLFFMGEKIYRFKGETHQDVLQQLDSGFTHTKEVKE